MSLSSLHLMFFSLLLAMGISTSHPKHGLKSMNFTLYQQDIVRKTDFLVVPGVTGANLSITTSPFGSIFAFHDNLTTTPDPSSKVLGTAEGFGVTSSFDGYDNLSVGKITLDLKDHKGSLSAVGILNNVYPSDIPVVGGTGDFLFVQGHIATTPVSLTISRLLYKLEFHLYWPPYVAQAI